MSNEDLEELVLPDADHYPRYVTNHGANPTERADEINASLAEPLQYPPEQPAPRYHYDEPEDDPNDAYPWFGGELLRCSRDGRMLPEAWEFFNRKRLELRWSHETPVYRTGRFWCKRIWRWNDGKA